MQRAELGVGVLPALGSGTSTCSSSSSFDVLPSESWDSNFKPVANSINSFESATRFQVGNELSIQFMEWWGLALTNLPGNFLETVIFVLKVSKQELNIWLGGKKVITDRLGEIQL